MLVNCLGDFNAELGYKAGDVFKAKTSSGKIPYSGAYKSFDLCFTFSQQISGGE